MKRALAILMAALFAMFSGVEYIVPKNDEFTLNTETSHSYWSPDNGEDYDYATLYRMQYGSDSQNRQPCDTTTTIPHREYGWDSRAPYCPVHSDAWSGNPDAETWLEFGESVRKEGVKDIKSWSYEGTDDEEFNITAPGIGTILTSHYACDYGHRMDFQFTVGTDTYTMRIDNAKCWWCCRNKDVSDGYYTATTKDSLKGREMPAGALLCIGKKGTSVSISRVN